MNDHDQTQEEERLRCEACDAPHYEYELDTYGLCPECQTMDTSGAGLIDYTHEGPERSGPYHP